jgi:hypothetical protein
MTDIERELRETMRDQASQLVRTPLATRALMRRARLRCTGTVAVAGALVMAVTLVELPSVVRCLSEGRSSPPIDPRRRPPPDLDGSVSSVCPLRAPHRAVRSAQS